MVAVAAAGGKSAVEGAIYRSFCRWFREPVSSDSIVPPGKRRPAETSCFAGEARAKCTSGGSPSRERSLWPGNAGRFLYVRGSEKGGLAEPALREQVTHLLKA